MSSTNQREAWVDVLKGLAIMLVVLGHNQLTILCPIVFNIIFSFHIPLFFFISGYLFKPDIAGYDLCRKRVKSLLWPYIFTIAIVSLIYITIKSSPSPLWYIVWGFYGNGPNLPKAVLHLWFLPHLFLVSLFVWALLKYMKIINNYVIARLVVVAILLVSGVLGIHMFWNVTIPESISNLFSIDINVILLNGLLQNPAYSKTQLLNNERYFFKGLPFSADIILVTAAFFISGFFVRKNNLENIFNKHSIVLLMIVLFSVFHVFYNYTIDLNLRRYDNLLISSLLAWTGIFICTYVSRITSSISSISAILQYIGRYSLVIFIFHPIIQSKTYNTTLALLPDTAHSIAILSSFAAGVCLPLLLNWLFLERLKYFRYWYYAK